MGWLQVLASALGPFVAVLIVLKLNPRNELRAQRTETLRKLLSLRYAPWHADYHTTINLIPIDFKGQKDVMAAYNAYMRAVDPAGTTNNDATTIEKQKNLIMAIAKVLKYPIDEEFMDRPSYVPTAHANLLTLDIESRKAWIRIAEALESQLKIMTNQTGQG